MDNLEMMDNLEHKVFQEKQAQEDPRGHWGRLDLLVHMVIPVSLVLLEKQVYLVNLGHKAHLEILVPREDEEVLV
jgi:hypothetical protein